MCSQVVKFPGGQEAPPDGMIQVAVDHIQPYDGNARLVPNTKREELKQITLRDGAPPGLLVVTRRPGASQLVLARGGNTRLEIVRELRDTYPDDPRWQRIWVRYEPFDSELQLAVNMLQENEARGDLLFIERSMAFCHVYDLWRTGPVRPKNDSILAFLRDFGARFGKPPSPAEAYRMKYAVETLHPLVPTALTAGEMTDRAVRRLIEYRGKICDLWVTCGFGEKAEFVEYFHSHVGRQERELAELARFLAQHADEDDDPLPVHEELQIDYKKLSDALAYEMAQLEHVTVGEAHIRDWIDDVLRGTPAEYIATTQPADGSPVDPEDIAAFGLDRPEPLDLDAYDTPDITDLLRAEHAQKQRDEEERLAAMAAPKPVVDRLTVASFRETAFQTACRIAARHKFSTLVLPFDRGIGFLVADTIVQGDDERVPLARAAPWWVLVSCGLILDLPPALADAHLPEQSLLRASIVSRQTELIAHVMGSPASFGRYLAALSDLDMADFLLLVKASQQIIRVARGDDVLWEEVTSGRTSSTATKNNSIQRSHREKVFVR